MVLIGSTLGVASCLAVSAAVSPAVWGFGEGAIARTFLTPYYVMDSLSHKENCMSITVKGTIQRSDMGAGTWALVTDDGVTYEVQQRCSQGLA